MYSIFNAAHNRNRFPWEKCFTQQYNLQITVMGYCGAERYRSLIPSYLKDAICAIFVFDVSSNSSLT